MSAQRKTPGRRPAVLVVDDEKNTREGLARALRADYDVLLADSGRRALEVLDERRVDVVLSDVRMPGMHGMELLERVLARTPRPIFILLTAYGRGEEMAEAMRRGATDYLLKPINLDELGNRVARALRERDMEAENRRLREQLDERFGLEHIIGRSPPMQEVFDTLRQIAPSRATVLVEGESGTGKELAARALHRLSPRRDGPFVAVHCAALSETLLESELFGHEKGAFTGATERRPGRFERADGGTLFLDEISEIETSVQVKILRVLEERCFERVGGTETVSVDVRLVAATNRNLAQLVEDGRFREDLFYRLNVVVLRMPPLRERPEDIPLLVHHFVERLAEENDKTVAGVTGEAMDLLGSYRWPGNVRELRNAVERMVVLSRGGKLTVRDVPGPIREAAGSGTPGAAGARLTLDEAERQMIERALRAQNGNRTRAAEQLGISRRTLHRKLNEYGLRDFGREGED